MDKPFRSLFADTGFPNTGLLQSDIDTTPIVYLLLPIKEANDIVYGERYVSKLMEDGRQVKVNLLHVTKSTASKNADFTFENDIDHGGEIRAQILIRQASLHLTQARISHRTFILSDGVAAAILDAAELLDCDAIVLPLPPTKTWSRWFSCGIVRKIEKSSRTVPVVIVDLEGAVVSVSGQLKKNFTEFEFKQNVSPTIN